MEEKYQAKDLSINGFKEGKINLIKLREFLKWKHSVDTNPNHPGNELVDIVMGHINDR